MKFTNVFSSTKDAKIKGARQLERITEPIKFIIEKSEEFQIDQKENEKKIAELKEDLASIKEKFMEFDKTLGSRRNCLLVHGVDEKIANTQIKWSLKIIKNDIGVEFTPIGHTA